MINFFSSSDDNFIAIDDFNGQPTDSIMKDFMRANGFMNLKSNSKGKAPVLI